MLFLSHPINQQGAATELKISKKESKKKFSKKYQE